MVPAGARPGHARELVRPQTKGGGGAAHKLTHRRLFLCNCFSWDLSVCVTDSSLRRNRLIGREDNARLCKVKAVFGPKSG